MDNDNKVDKSGVSETVHRCQIAAPAAECNDNSVPENEPERVSPYEEISASPTLGYETRQRLAKSDVLISGMGGVGVEIAKHMVLGGVRSITIHDESITTYNDLSSQFCLREEDIGKNRADSTLPRLSELNSYVTVSVSSYTEKLNTDYLSKFTAVVLTNSPLEEQLELGEFCHQNDIYFIVADTRGLVGQVFCDFGESFAAEDINSEKKFCNIVAISKDVEGIVTCIDEGLGHGYTTGDFVRFSEVEGMTELNNGEPRQITVIGSHTFSIGDTREYGEYVSGGLVQQVKVPMKIQFKSLQSSIDCPEFCKTATSERSNLIHVSYLALHEFIKLNGRPPKSHNTTDADSLLDSVKKQYKDRKVLDEDFIRMFSFCSAGNICPVQSVIGGLAAQEVIKACSKTYIPVQQWLYVDASDCLPQNAFKGASNEIFQPSGCRYDGQTAVFGIDMMIKIFNSKCLLIGTEAVGSEILKNWSMMGVGTGEGGRIMLREKDLDDNSRIDEQYSYRPFHFQRSNDVISTSKIINPINEEINVDIIPSSEDEKTFTDPFFRDLTCVVNTTDNSNLMSRMVEGCANKDKPLFVAHMTGIQGNIRVILSEKSARESTSHVLSEQSIINATDKNHTELNETPVMRSFTGPSLSTTSSVVAGLMCLEFIKMLQSHSSATVYKDSFIDLALPIITFSGSNKTKKGKVSTQNVSSSKTSAEWSHAHSSSTILQASQPSTSEKPLSVDERFREFFLELEQGLSANFGAEFKPEPPNKRDQVKQFRERSVESSIEFYDYQEREQFGRGLKRDAEFLASDDWGNKMFRPDHKNPCVPICACSPLRLLVEFSPDLLQECKQEVCSIDAEFVTNKLASVAVIEGDGTVLLRLYATRADSVIQYKWDESPHVGPVAEQLSLDVITERVTNAIKGRKVIGHNLNCDLKACNLVIDSALARDTHKYMSDKARMKRGISTVESPVLNPATTSDIPTSSTAASPLLGSSSLSSSSSSISCSSFLLDSGLGLKDILKSYGYDIQNGVHCPVEDATAALFIYLKHREEWEAKLTIVNAP